MVQPAQPLHQPPLECLQNAIQVAQLYEIDGTMEDKSRALQRVRLLIGDALDKLSEPVPQTIDATQRILAGSGVSVDEREARDIAQVVTFAALNWREGDGWPNR